MISAASSRSFPLVSLLSCLAVAGVCLPAPAWPQPAAQTADGACASVTTETIPADRLEAVLADGMTLVKKQKGAAALACFERALASAEAHGLPAQRAEATLGVGAAQRVAGRYPEAQALHERALAMFRELGDAKGEGRTQRNLGLDFYYQGQGEKARAALLEAKALFEREQDAEALALVYSNLMYAYEPGPEKDALRQEALRLARDPNGTADATNECSILHEWGDELYSQGRYGDAYARLTDSLTCYSRTSDAPASATVLVSLGRLHRAHGRPDLAMPYYTRALDVQERAGDTIGAIQTINAMAVGYANLGQDEVSLSHYHQALARATAANSPQTMAFIRGQIGGYYLAAQDPVRALPLLEESLRLDPRHATVRKAQLANALTLLGRHDEALKLANESVADARKEGSSQAIFALKHRENVHYYAGRLEEARADVAEALTLIEEVRTRTVATDFMKRGYSATHQGLFSASIELAARQGDAIQALEIAEQARARAFLDLLATRSSSSASESAVAANGASGSGATGALGARPAGGSSGSGAAGAGAAAGAATGSTTIAAITRRPEATLARRGAPEAKPTESGSAAAGATTGANDSRTRESGTTTPDAGRTGAATAAAGQTTTAQSVPAGDTSTPRGASSSHTTLAHEATPAEAQAARLDSSRTVAAPTIADVRATARRLRSTLLIYWVGESALRVWVVSPSGLVRTTLVPVSAIELQRQVTMASATIDSAAAGLGAAGNQARPWRALYQTLIAPVEGMLPTAANSLVTIVPHGPLFQVSFAALQDARGRYLLERYRLHYTPAVGVLAFTGARAYEQAGGPDAVPTALLVGDPEPLVQEPGEEPMPRLPWAGREVEEISRVLAPWRSDILSQRDASEAAVRARVEQADLLHFATHGVVQQQGTVTSFLALSDTRAPHSTAPAASVVPAFSSTAASALPMEDDGRLTADEVYGLRLRARLVVLSACRTALGPLSGDGVIGFTRAFLYAGASSVVATSWDVPDEAGYEVMRRFYLARVADERRVAQASSRQAAASRSATADALRTAQLSVLSALRKGTLMATTPGGPVALREHPLLWAGFLVVGEP